MAEWLAQLALATCAAAATTAVPEGDGAARLPEGNGTENTPENHQAGDDGGLCSRAMA